jgi:glycerol-1-phosphatase
LTDQTRVPPGDNRSVPLSPLLNAYDNVILDLDGTVWVGSQATPGAPEAVTAIRAAGKRLAFVTNDGTHTPEDYVRRLWSVGCTASADEIVSVGSVIQYTLAEFQPGTKVFIIGPEAVFRHVVEAGQRIVNDTPQAERADVVVVVAHSNFNYSELFVATRAMLNGAEALCGGRDPNFPFAGGLAPGTGAVVAALEYATGRSIRNVAKPDRRPFQVALERMGRGRTLMIGDHLISDLGGASAAGIDAAIVLSGVTSSEQAAAAVDPAPVAVAGTLAELVLGSYTGPPAGPSNPDDWSGGTAA